MTSCYLQKVIQLRHIGTPLRRCQLCGRCTGDRILDILRDQGKSLLAMQFKFFIILRYRSKESLELPPLFSVLHCKVKKYDFVTPYTDISTVVFPNPTV